MKATIRRIGCFCAERRARVRGRLRGLAAAIVLAGGLPAWAQSDEDFLAAREAFRSGNRAKVELLAPRLSGHVLAPYVTYYRLRPRLEEMQAFEVREALAQLADGPLGDRLRNDWLKLLGKRAQWETFDADREGLRSEDLEVTCYALQRPLRSGETQARATVLQLWRTTYSAPEGCNAAFDTAVATGAFGQADVSARVRLALEKGQTSSALALNKYLPGDEALDAKALAAAAANPRRYLEAKSPATLPRREREVVLFALQRLARTAPQDAAARLRLLAPAFGPKDREYIWGRLAYQAALQHDPEALAWYGLAGTLSDEQLAWRARAALRWKNWPEVVASVDALSEAGRAEPEWRYWKARALKQQGKAVEANALFAALSTEHHFYGLLAAEELGEAIGPLAESYRPSESDIRSIGELGPIRRALALYQLGLRIEGNREWQWAIFAMDDRQLLATAELARRNELWDRAINTAERTRSQHDFALRYLAPYREQFRVYAAENGIDEAWLLGLVRQESRFVADARSSAGAMGLMQLMPATARWVAGKLGVRNFRPTSATDLDVNISFGAYYLRYVLESLDNNAVLASAGYNAGPGRARAWRPDETMEGAIYAETIPFEETRDYVKKVMANASYYARVLGRGLVSLKDRLGTIPPRELR